MNIKHTENGIKKENVGENTVNQHYTQIMAKMVKMVEDTA